MVCFLQLLGWTGPGLLLARARRVLHGQRLRVLQGARRALREGCPEAPVERGWRVVFWAVCRADCQAPEGITGASSGCQGLQGGNLHQLAFAK